MAHSRRLLLLVVLLAALSAFAAATETTKESDKQDKSAAVPSSSSVPINPRRMRGVATTRSGGTAPTPAAAERAPPPSPAVADTPNYEQQVLVVKGNPSPEKLNDEIRKAIRALLGPDGDQVQIRELKDANELRRIAPGARPIGVQLVQ